MSITAQVEANEINKINQVLLNVKKSGKKVNGIAKQAMIFALQSAAKHTKPGAGANISKLAKKHRVRPAERMPETGFFWYKWITKGGSNSRFFKSQRKIRTRKDGTLVRILRGIKYWSKKRNGFDYLPFEGKGKYSTTDKRFKIPFAGWAKLGWIMSLGKLGKAVEIRTKHGAAAAGSLVTRKTGNEIYFEASNNVSYVRKTSPQSAAIGLRNARKRIDHIYLKQLDRDMQRVAK